MPACAGVSRAPELHHPLPGPHDRGAYAARGEGEPEDVLDAGCPRHTFPVTTRVGRAQQRAASASAQDGKARGRGHDPRAVDRRRLANSAGVVERADRERPAVIRRQREPGHGARRANRPDDAVRGWDERSAQFGEARAFPMLERSSSIRRARDRVEVGPMTRRPQEPDVRPASGERDRQSRRRNRELPPGAATDRRPLEDMAENHIGVATTEREGDDLAGRPSSVPARAAVVRHVQRSPVLDVGKAVVRVRELERRIGVLRRERRQRYASEVLAGAVERSNTWPPSTQRLRVPTAAAASGWKPRWTPCAVSRADAPAAVTSRARRPRASANRIDRRLLRPMRATPLRLPARRRWSRLPVRRPGPSPSRA